MGVIVRWARDTALMSFVNDFDIPKSPLVQALNLYSAHWWERDLKTSVNKL